MSLRRVSIYALILTSGTLVRAQDLPDLPPRPHGPYEIHGVVVDGKTGQPLPEVELSFQENAQPTNAPFEIIQSESDGSFRIGNLAEGKYTVRAARQGYAQQALQQHENYWTGVAVGPGKDSLHVRFALSPSATIMGQVTDENGEAIRQAEITLWAEQLENGKRSITQVDNTLTDDEGRYRIGHLRSGRYSASVHAVPWYSRYVPRNAKSGTQVPLPDVVYPTLYYPNSRDWHGMEWIELPAGQTENADFRLTPEPSAHLRIQIGEGENGQRPNVELMTEQPGGGWNNAAQSVSVADGGVLEISGIPAGPYRLQESGSRKVEQDVDVTGNSELPLEGATAGGTTVHGLIKSVDSGQKIGNGFLQLKDANGRTYRALFHGEWAEQGQPAGSFVFENVPAGPQAFEFEILQPFDLMVRGIESKGAKVTGSSIETDGKQEVYLVVTVIQISNAITGTVLKNGKPFAGAMILLMPEGGKDWQRLARRDQSDSDGTFRVATVLPGKYALMALENGWEMEWTKPEVLQPFLAKARKIEIEESPIEPVTIEMQ
jgi:protocatechuate 3,4-dioxygenase beta subunit